MFRPRHLFLVAFITGCCAWARASTTVTDAIQSGDVTGLRHETTIATTDATFTYTVPAVTAPLQNRRMIWRNLDSRVAVAMKLNVDGRPDLSSAAAVINSIITPGMTDEQKAIAIWQLVVNWRYHYVSAEDSDETHDPIKTLNVYGYGICDISAQAITQLAAAAGLGGRIYGLNGHVVCELSYGGTWHMFDGDHQVFYRAADGHVMSVDELAADPSPITASAFDPVGSTGTSMANMYTTTADNEWYLPGTSRHRVEPVLQPLDEAIFDLAPAPLYHESAQMRNLYPSFGAPPVVANGTLTRQLDFSAAPNQAIFPVDWPFVFLNGSLALQAAVPANIEVAISRDDTNFDVVPVSAAGGMLTASFANWFPAKDTAVYHCSVRVRTLDGTPLSASVTAGRATWVFQFAPRAIQQLNGNGTTVRGSATVGAGLPSDWQGIQIAHDWDELTNALAGNNPQRVSQEQTSSNSLTDGVVQFDNSNILVFVATAGAPLQNFHILLDTDNNAKTGYPQQRVGTDFMVENNVLYRFTGSTQNSWSWATVATIDVKHVTTNVTQLTIPMTALSANGGGTWNVRIQQWSGWTNLIDELPRGQTSWQIDVPQWQTQAVTSDSDVASGQVAFASSNVVFSFQTKMTAVQNFHIYLDTDAFSGTGYKRGSIGAEYLIENGWLYKFSGKSPSSWSWAAVGAVTRSRPSANVIQVSFPAAMLSLAPGSRLNTVFENWQGWTTLRDQLPRGTQVWPIIAPGSASIAPSSSVSQSGAAATDLVHADASFAASHIDVTIQTVSASILAFLVWIDSDQNSSTGYSRNTVGCEYLVQNSTLYKFAGATPSDWRWTPVATVTVQNLDARTLQVQIPTAGTSLGTAGPRIFIQNYRPDWSQVLDSLPRSGTGWF